MALLGGRRGRESAQCLTDLGFIVMTLSAVSDRQLTKDTEFIQILRYSIRWNLKLEN